MANADGQYSNMYNAADVHLFVNNQLVKAFQDGAMVSVTWPNERQTLSVDAQGAGFFTQSNDRRATMTINLAETSADNARFAELVNSGKSFPVTLVHKGEKVTMASAQFSKTPDVAFGKQATGRTWTIVAPKASYDNKNK